MQPVLDKLTSQNKDDGYIRQELAEALHALGRAAEAKPHFAKGYELLSADEWAMRNEAEKIARMKELGV
jgi:hypothetical protein